MLSGKEAIISRMRRGRPWVGPAVRQFPDPRVEPFLTELMEGTITLLRRSRSAPGLREKGTAAKSRLLRIATRGWIDPLGLVSWLLRLTLRQLPHRHHHIFQRFRKSRNKGCKVSDRCIVVEGSEGRSVKHQWPFTQTDENRPYPPLLAPR